MKPRPATPADRFPTLRAAACGVGFLVAAYVWMGWGFRWDVTPDDIVEGAPPIPFPSGWVGRYVRLRGRAWRANCNSTAAVLVRDEERSVVARTDIDVALDALVASIDGRFFPTAGGFTGRVVRMEGASSTEGIEIDTFHERINGTTAFAFVIGFWSAAFGWLYVSDWRRARRRFALAAADDGTPDV